MILMLRVLVWLFIAYNAFLALGELAALFQPSYSTVTVSWPGLLLHGAMAIAGWYADRALRRKQAAR